MTDPFPQANWYAAPIPVCPDHDADLVDEAFSFWCPHGHAVSYAEVRQMADPDD